MSYLAAATARGYPLADAIAAYGRSVRGSFGGKLAEVAEFMRGGIPLSDALAVHHVLPHRMLSLIGSAEAAGKLADLFAVLSRREHGRAERRTRLIGFAVYPVFLSVFLGLIGLLLSVIVAPKFAEITHSFGSIPPVVFQIAPTVWKWSILTALTIAGYLVLVALPSPGGPRARQELGLLDLVKWRLPFARQLERYEGIRIFAQALEIELAGGVPLREALKRSCGVEVHRSVSLRLDRLYTLVESGVPLSQAAEISGALPGRFARLLALGEQGGDLRPVLSEIVRECDDAADRWTELLRAIAVPVVVLVLGVGVLAIVLGVHLSILDIMYSVMWQGGQ
jgi:type II secretory pathway component PulF